MFAYICCLIARCVVMFRVGCFAICCFGFGFCGLWICRWWIVVSWGCLGLIGLLLLWFVCLLFGLIWLVGC